MQFFDFECTFSSLTSDRKWKIMINGHFKTVSSHFFGNCMTIFHKTEVQTVILRCLTGLKLDSIKGYELKCKYFHFRFFRDFVKKMHLCFFAVLFFFAFRVITIVPIMIQTCLAPQNDHLNLSFVKDFMWFTQKWPQMVVKWPYIRCKF